MPAKDRLATGESEGAAPLPGRLYALEFDSDKGKSYPKLPVGQGIDLRVV
jgi:hypothetical protein